MGCDTGPQTAAYIKHSGVAKTDGRGIHKLQQGVKLSFGNILSGMNSGSIQAVDKDSGTAITLDCDLSQRQKDIVLAGGLLNYTKENS